MLHISITTICLVLSSISTLNSRAPCDSPFSLECNKTTILQQGLWNSSSSNDVPPAKNDLSSTKTDSDNIRSRQPLGPQKTNHNASLNDASTNPPVEESEDKLSTDVKGIVTYVFISLALFTVLCLSWICFLKGGEWRKRIRRICPGRQPDQIWIINSEGETAA